jgi:hypothetical protein
MARLKPCPFKAGKSNPQVLRLAALAQDDRSFVIAKRDSFFGEGKDLGATSSR